jgi:hypothetical protein
MVKNNLKEHYSVKFCVKLGAGWFATDTYKRFRKGMVMISHSMKAL